MIEFKTDKPLTTAPKVTVATDCHLCDGSGKYTINDVEYICPSCNGSGKVQTDLKRY